MQITLADVARLAGGRLSDPSVAQRTVRGLRSLRAATPEDLSFFRGEARFLADAQATCAAAVLIAPDADGVTRPRIVVDDVEAALARLAGALRDAQRPAPRPGIHPLACVDPSAALGSEVAVGPFAVVEAGARLGEGARVDAHAFVGRGAVLGARCWLHPGAVVLDHAVLGERVIVWPHAVVGRDGFGFFRRDGHYYRIPQVGGVVLGDDVEVGSLSTVDRGAVDPTQVEDGVKIDAHCHVAHNCRIGADALLIGYARMGGSVEIGAGAILAEDAAVAERRKVGAGAIVGSAATVQYEDVAPGARVLGFPARPHMLAKRIEAAQARLPKLLEEVRGLRRRLTSLEERLGAGPRRRQPPRAERADEVA